MIEKIRKNSTVQFFIKTTLHYMLEFFTGFAIQLALGIVYTSLGIAFVAVQLNIEVIKLISGQESFLFTIIMGVALGVTIVILVLRFFSEQVEQPEVTSTIIPVVTPVELNKQDAG